MRIDDFLRYENPDDRYESLGVPPVPEEITRREMIRYRARVLRYLEGLQRQIADTAPPATFMRLRRSSSKSARRMKAIGRSRRSRFRVSVEPFISETKTKKLREHYASQRGRPYHMRETLPAETRLSILRECRDVAVDLLKEIDNRFPNLPPEDKPAKKGRPIVPPEIDEFL